MPRRALIKIIILSLVSLGTVVLFTVLSLVEIERRRQANMIGVPGPLLAACFIVYPLLSAAVGLVSGTEGHYMCFMPVALAFVISVASMLQLGLIFPYAVIGYVCFALSYFVSRFLRARGGLVQFVLSRPLGALLVMTAYVLMAALLLCPLDALDMMGDYQSPMFFTVPLVLVGYPLLFILTGAVAGRFPKRLWPVPLVALAVLLAVGNCFEGGLFSVGSFSDMSYYIKQNVPAMLVYVGLGYTAMFLSRAFFWNNPECYTERLLGALSALAMGPLIYGAANVPGFLWGHPLWGETLWYALHLGLAAAVGVLAGRDIWRCFLMPFIPLLVTYIQMGPPVAPGTEPKLPPALGERWAVICFFACALCMLLKFFLQPKDKRV